MSRIEVRSDGIGFELLDGRSVTIPLAWYPRLAHATREEKENWRLIGQGEGVHWPDLDEDVAIDDVLAGRPSGESQASLSAWLEKRRPR